MPPESPLQDFSRRERQIMEVIYARGSADAAEIQEALPDPPGYSAVRALLRVLVDKGHLETSREGTKLIYRAIRQRDDVRRGILAQVVETYFGGSAQEAVSALLDISDPRLSKAELGELAARIEKARKEGR